MNKSWFDLRGISKNCILAASALSLTAQLVPYTGSFAATTSKKSASMQIPINEKLDETNADSQKNQELAAKADLSPMTLNSDQSAASTGSGSADATATTTATTATSSSASSSETSSDGTEVLKTGVSTNDFVPKGPVGKGPADIPPVSIKTGPSSIDEKVIKDAHKGNLMPLALMESRDEIDKAQEARFDAEKTQLSDLWNSTLTRSPDIQFVTQKLLPTSKPGHTTEIMMRFLSCAMFGGMAACNVMAPNMGMYAATGMGGSLIQQALGVSSTAAAKKAKLSETETIMLYTMVRGTADKLVEHYREYKKGVCSLRVAETDFTDLQNMVKDTRANQDAAKQIDMEYTLKKAQRDMNALTMDVRKQRQDLIDLAGTDAIAKLDKQMDEEQATLDPAVAALTKGELQAAEDIVAANAAKAAKAAEAAKTAEAAKSSSSVKGQVVANGPVKPKGDVSTTR